MLELDKTPQFLHQNSNKLSTSLLVLVDKVRTSTPQEKGIFSGWQWDSIKQKLMRSGFDPDQVQFALSDQISKLPDCKVIVGLGEATLRKWTDKKSVDKFHMTPLSVMGKVYIPTFDMERFQKQFEVGLYQELAFLKAFQFILSPRLDCKHEERFLLNPPLAETLSILDEIKNKPELSCDVETGYGQINTVGFAWSPHDAIAINVLPDRLSEENFFLLWTAIAEVLEGPSRKIFQNFIYDTSYFSAYGIRTNNIYFDTMFAQKIMWPEFNSNLGNVGRIYTNRPYWKDDGKVETEEGAKKDWGNVRDWVKHYEYNCRDTSGTLEASMAQREDLKRRGLDSFYFNYISKLKDPIREMCARGMPLSLPVREKLKADTETRIQELLAQFEKETGQKVNLRSPKQKLAWLKSMNITVPKKFDKEKGVSKETTDSTAIKKIRMKHPELTSLKIVQEVSILQKALSSYINFTPRTDGRMPFSLNGCGTETLRFSGGKDGWGRGINIQTLPREGGEVSIKQMFVAPEGCSFLEVDLQAAESRYVAYASADAKLIQMLEDGEDVHKHVAMNILRALGKSTEEYSKKWRNLAKPVGHGGNYLMQEGTLAENIFKMMEILIPKKEAKIMLEAYHREFQAIRPWQNAVRQELWRKRKLKAPSGWERYFYGRPDDNMWREGIAWVPQHTIPWITNNLMFHLVELRKEGKLMFELLAQVHDSLILLVPDERLEDTARAALSGNAWHPEVNLPGGRMIIPRSAEAGKSMADKKEITVGE